MRAPFATALPIAPQLSLISESDFVIESGLGHVRAAARILFAFSAQAFGESRECSRPGGSGTRGDFARQ